MSACIQLGGNQGGATPSPSTQSFGNAKQAFRQRVTWGRRSIPLARPWACTSAVQWARTANNRNNVRPNQPSRDLRGSHTNMVRNATQRPGTTSHFELGEQNPTRVPTIQEQRPQSGTSLDGSNCTSIRSCATRVHTARGKSGNGPPNRNKHRPLRQGAKYSTVCSFAYDTTQNNTKQMHSQNFETQSDQTPQMAKSQIATAARKAHKEPSGTYAGAQTKHPTDHVPHTPHRLRGQTTADRLSERNGHYWRHPTVKGAHKTCHDSRYKYGKVENQPSRAEPRNITTYITTNKRHATTKMLGNVVGRIRKRVVIETSPYHPT